MIGLDIFITLLMAYVTYINYKTVGPNNMWTLLAGLCTFINVLGLFQRF